MKSMNMMVRGQVSMKGDKTDGANVRYLMVVNVDGCSTGGDMGRLLFKNGC